MIAKVCGEYLEDIACDSKVVVFQNVRKQFEKKEPTMSDTENWLSKMRTESCILSKMDILVSLARINKAKSC